jgi:hypothetical protein
MISLNAFSQTFEKGKKVIAGPRRMLPDSALRHADEEIQH